MLTNTLIPRDTKTLVAGVSARRLAEPGVVNPILDEIQGISDEARSLLGSEVHINRAHLIDRLEVSQAVRQARPYRSNMLTSRSDPDQTKPYPPG